MERIIENYTIYILANQNSELYNLYTWGDHDSNTWGDHDSNTWEDHDSNTWRDNYSYTWKELLGIIQFINLRRS